MSQPTDEFPVIVWLDGSLANPHWVVDSAEMVLGRDEGCDIVIPVRQISRQHLRIIMEGGACVIEDLRSKNGTWVNGYRLTGMRQLGRWRRNPHRQGYSPALRRLRRDRPVDLARFTRCHSLGRDDRLAYAPRPGVA